MRKYTLVFMVVLSFSFSEAISQGTQLFFNEADAFLKTYVSDGKVAYGEIHKNPESLNAVLQLAKKVKVSPSEAKTYQAFWINAYNLSVIKGIVDNYPISSPLDKSGFFDTIKHELGGTSVTLNDIENKLLRAQFDDARFHFVLVCGAKGCPPLLSMAYTPENLEGLLQKQTVKALNRKSFIQVSEKTVALSEIFKWYKEDFVRGGKTEIDFINQFREEEINPASKITYYSYDWSLNAK